jgi:tetratricopeptide (TPR) repeat protein
MSKSPNSIRLFASTCLCFLCVLAACQLGRAATPLQNPSCEDAPPSPRTDAPRQLASAQARLRNATHEASPWVAAGHAWVRVARTLARPELYRNAGACASAALSRDPRNGAARALRAVVFLNEHRFAETRALMRETLGRDDDDPMSWGLLSDALLELGDLDGAIEAAQRMVDLKPSLLSYGRAAHLSWLQGDSAAAKLIYQRAIEAGRQHADPEPRAFMVVQAALLFWHEGDYAGADAGFELALSLLPNYAPALEGRGRVALSRGDYQAAIHWLERAQARAGLCETSWLLGDAYALAGRRDAAERSYARVVQDGREHDPRTLAAFYATKNRDIGEAVSLARAEFAARSDIYTKDVLAWALFRAGKLDEALRLSTEAVAAGTRDARLWFHASEIAKATGDTARGQDLMARALRQNPRFDPMLLEQSRAELPRTL